MKLHQQQLNLSDGGTLKLVPVTEADNEFLLHIYASTREEELAQAEWQPGQKEAFLKWQSDMQRQQYEARFPDAEYKVIQVDSQRAGRVWVGENDNEIRLLDIALLPEFQNRGVGNLLLRQLIDEAKRSQKPLRHMVFMLNSNAHRFYERLGFVMIEDLGAYRHMEFRSEPPAVAGGPAT
ncbi:MAG TPA: GNAT family N-acetyltransferase [Pyrinomonadaceae bacterium]|nr:GNAT family N-acetyltransferase [Pyrinomonadaceae bacterium]